jgi:hypothetical protein
MQRLDITNLIEFSGRKFNPVVLADGPAMRDGQNAAGCPYMS